MCNNIGGGNWIILIMVLFNVGNGLIFGVIIDEVFLLAKNFGLFIMQIDNVIILCLGCVMVVEGDCDWFNGILFFEVCFNSLVQFFFDIIYGYKKNKFECSDMNWVGCNGLVILVNMQVDGDCVNGCMVIKGIFVNLQYFLEYWLYVEDIQFYSINLGMKLKIIDVIGLDVQVNVMCSDFYCELFLVLFQIVLNLGIMIEYDNISGMFVLKVINIFIGVIDILNLLIVFGWNGGCVNVQEEKCQVCILGICGVIDIDVDVVDIKFGGVYDNVLCCIELLNNDNYWFNIVCGCNFNVFLFSFNMINKNGCNGIGVVGFVVVDYLGYGIGYMVGVLLVLL